MMKKYHVLAENSNMSEGIQEYCKGLHIKLRGGVVFAESIPKTASGKILRRLIVDQDRQK